jgi:hypothetical protein
MNRWMRAILALCVVCTPLLQSRQALAHAGPRISRFTDAGQFVDTDLCGYPIHVRWTEEGRVYRWFNADGTIRRLVVHHVFSEVARANGKAATGIDRQKLTNNHDGSYLFNGSWIFFLPDGSHIQSAGRIRVSHSFSKIFFEAGPHPVVEGRLAELFCPPMS